jgi:hypothetical protein
MLTLEASTMMSPRLQPSRLRTLRTLTLSTAILLSGVGGL